MNRMRGNADNMGGNARNEMEMQVWGISMGMPGISLEMKNIWGIKEAIQGIMMET